MNNILHDIRQEKNWMNGRKATSKKTTLLTASLKSLMAIFDTFQITTANADNNITRKW